MKSKKERFTLTALFVGAVAGMFLFALTREPSYDGVALNDWFATANRIGISQREHDHAIDAIIAMGPKAIPWLQKALARDSKYTLDVYSRSRTYLPPWLVRLMPRSSSPQHDLALTCRLLRTLEPDGATTVPILLSLIQRPKTDQAALVAQLRRFHPPAAQFMPFMDEWIASRDGVVQSLAVALLGDYPEESLQRLPTLVKYFHDKAPWWAALVAIGNCGPAASNALPAVDAVLRGPPRYKLATAAYVITRVSPEQTREMAAYLSQRLDLAEENDRLNILWYLRAMGTNARPALSTLVSLLRGPSDLIRARAAATIGTIGPGANSAIENLHAANEGKARAAKYPPAAMSPYQHDAQNPALAEARIEALVALARIDSSLADDCGATLAGILHTLVPSLRRVHLRELMEDKYDPGRITILFQLLEGKADDLLPSLAREAWNLESPGAASLIPFLKRIIERRPANSPLSIEAANVLKLIEPLTLGHH